MKRPQNSCQSKNSGGESSPRLRLKNPNEPLFDKILASIAFVKTQLLGRVGDILRASERRSCQQFLTFAAARLLLF